MADAKWRGVEHHGHAYRVRVSLGKRGRFATKSFPLTTPPEIMQRWREVTRAKALITRTSDVGTFRGDAAKYLRAVQGMPAIQSRMREIQSWVTVFGDRRRDEITSLDIRLQRDAWATAPRDPHPTHRARVVRPLTPATINKRLRALSNLYRVLDPTTPNPVRAVDELPEPAPRSRARSYAEIEQLLAALPDRRYTKKGRTVPSGTKIRLRCMAYSPITPVQLQRLTPEDLELTTSHARLRLPARAKGAGAKAIWMDLSAPGKAAYDAFVKAKLFGDFSTGNLRRSLAWAAKKIGVTPIRPYDLRHSYLSLVYQVTQSREAVSSLGQHASWDTSWIYAQRAEDGVRAAHTARVNAAIGGMPVGQRRKRS